jgi:hypothetical protein
MRQNRAQWMTAFEDAVLKLRPDFAGVIDWDCAVFYFNSGYSADDASVRYVSIPR